MQMQPWLALALARERQQVEIVRAADQQRSDHQYPSIRRRLGRSIIAIGTRVAAEPSLELVRSR